MAINKKETKTEERNYDVKVLSCREVNGAYALNLEVNGVTLYGAWYRTYTDKKTKEEKGFVAFPSHKGNDDKYYNHCWFPINENTLADIEKQMNAML